jgi:hypothetical protein
MLIVVVADLRNLCKVAAQSNIIAILIYLACAL